MKLGGSISHVSALVLALFPAKSNKNSVFNNTFKATNLSQQVNLS